MSHLPQYQTIPEIGPIRTELAPASELGDGEHCRAEYSLQLELARRREDAYEGTSNATAALFAGLLMGSFSTALTIWLVTLVF